MFTHICKCHVLKQRNCGAVAHTSCSHVIRDLHTLPVAGTNITQIAYCFKINKDNLEEKVEIQNYSKVKTGISLLRFVTRVFVTSAPRMRINYKTNHQTIYKNLEKNKFSLKERVEIFSCTTYIWFSGIIHILKILLISFAGEGLSVTVTLPTVNKKGSKPLLIQALHHFVKWN